MAEYKVCLIGAGSIGGDKPDCVDYRGGPVVTHAHAIWSHVHFVPEIVVDKDIVRARRVSEKWGFVRQPVRDISEMPDDVSIDVFVIATPPEYHFDVFCAVIKKKPKAIIIEKPVSTSWSQVEKMRLLAEELRIPVLVNYQRQYLQDYSASVVVDDVVKIRQVVCHYCRGFVRDGSHFLAFITSLFPSATIISPWKVPGFSDGPIGDVTMTCGFDVIPVDTGECIPVTMIAHDGRVADVFEIIVYGEYGNLEYRHHGKQVVWRQHREEKTFGAGYKSFGDSYECSFTGLRDALFSVYGALFVVLGGGTASCVGLECAAEVWEIIENVRNCKC